MNVWTHEQWLDLDAWEAELEADMKVTVTTEQEDTVSRYVDVYDENGEHIGNELWQDSYDTMTTRGLRLEADAIRRDAMRRLAMARRMDMEADIREGM